jgi:hypothetical protein
LAFQGISIKECCWRKRKGGKEMERKCNLGRKGAVVEEEGSRRKSSWRSVDEGANELVHT